VRVQRTVTAVGFEMRGHPAALPALKPAEGFALAITDPDVIGRGRYGADADVEQTVCGLDHLLASIGGAPCHAAFVAHPDAALGIGVDVRRVAAGGEGDGCYASGGVHG